MPITTLSSREFHQDSGRAKRAAKTGPVFITDRGRPALVILSIEEYSRLTEKQPSIGDLLSDPNTAHIDFEFPKMNFVSRPVDFD
jgi:prevent-host-death family protein